jgi:hypothetical protein
MFPKWLMVVQCDEGRCPEREVRVLVELALGSTLVARGPSLRTGILRVTFRS